MSATSPAAATSPAPSPPVGTSRAALPWQPAPIRDTALSAGAGAAAWAALIASTPYLAAAQFRDSTTVYLPPTVLQLSEAAGCSVSALAGAYNDLPVIRLSKETTGESAAPIAVAETQTFDAFDYLQLVPVDETLELATNAVRARRPVPDAEETFWETDYWEKLKRIKQEQQQRKDLRKQSKLAQEAKKALYGVGNNAVGFPATYTIGNTLSSTNSPSFLTPHSRQGSLSGHAGDTDTSPTMANLQSVQRQKRIAKGLLRRARYNESHNPSHPNPHTTRSASLLSQNSAGTPHSVVRRRARPRSYSTNSQQTDARGFQYSLSSAMSEGGHSALSDSLRTPPLLSINAGLPTREALATSLDMELSMSGGATKSGATTQSHTSAVATDRGTTPKVSPPLRDSMPSQRTSPAFPRKASDVHDSTSPLSYDSDHSSAPLRERKASTKDAAPTDASLTPPRGSPTPPKAIAALHVPVVTTAASSGPQAYGGGGAAATPNKVTEEASLPSVVTKAPSSARGSTGGVAPSKGTSDATPLSPDQGLSPVAVQNKPASRAAAAGSYPRPVVKGEPNARCATARPSPAARTGHAAGPVVTSRPPKAASLVSSSTRRLAVDKPAPQMNRGETNTSTSPPPLGSTRGLSPVTATSNAKGLQVQVPDIVVDNNRSESGDTRMNVPPAALQTTTSTDTTICETSDLASPLSPVPADGRSRQATAAPTPLSSPQVLPAQELTQGKSNALFTTPSGSATPRATAPTVPPSRTPTRETSMSPRFERVVAVHGASPSSPYPADAPLAASQESGRTPPSTPDTSPARSLAATQPARGPAGTAASREGSGILQVTAAPTPRLVESIPTKASGATTSTAAATAQPSGGQTKCETTGGERRSAASGKDAAGDDHTTATRIHARSRAEEPQRAKPEKKSAAACCTVM